MKNVISLSRSEEGLCNWALLAVSSSSKNLFRDSFYLASCEISSEM